MAKLSLQGFDQANRQHRHPVFRPFGHLLLCLLDSGFSCYSSATMFFVLPRPNMALNLAPFSRWTLRDKAAQRRLFLR